MARDRRQYYRDYYQRNRERIAIRRGTPLIKGRKCNERGNVWPAPMEIKNKVWNYMRKCGKAGIPISRAEACRILQIEGHAEQ